MRTRRTEHGGHTEGWEAALRPLQGQSRVKRAGVVSAVKAAALRGSGYTSPPHSICDGLTSEGVALRLCASLIAFRRDFDDETVQVAGLGTYLDLRFDGVVWRRGQWRGGAGWWGGG